MQLFIADFSVDTDRVIIHDLGVLDQMRKVLRMKKGDVFALQAVQSTQDKSKSSDFSRYIVQVDDWDHECVYGTVIKTEPQPEALGPSVTMYVAFPNKWDKAELIVQKLAELGVGRMVFWLAERSVLRKPNDNKTARMQKILREAVEQSWGWDVPELSFVTDKDFLVEEQVVIFDMCDDTGLPRQSQASSSQGRIGVVGPEGGLTQSDYAHFPHHIVSSLGNTILRMETAAIVGAYTLLSSS